MTKGSFDEFIIKTHSPSIQSLRGRKSSGGGRKKDPLSLESLEPWVTLDISRRSFFYNKSK